MAHTMRPPPNETPNMPMPTKKKLKRIEAHTDEELDAAIDVAKRHCEDAGLDFYTILHGIDAYMRRRKVRDDRRSAQAADDAYNDVMSDPWGNS